MCIRDRINTLQVGLFLPNARFTEIILYLQRCVNFIVSETFNYNTNKPLPNLRQVKINLLALEDILGCRPILMTNQYLFTVL